jgi:glutathione S-transferase
MLEECALPYNVHKINIGTNREQFAPEYLKNQPERQDPLRSSIPTARTASLIP